jgi:mono/diheme cytochrome c family protein
MLRSIVGWLAVAFAGWLGAAFVASDSIQGAESLQPAAERSPRALQAVPAQQPSAVASTDAALTPAAQYRAVLDRYCVTCHNGRLKTADLMLDAMDVANPPAGAEVWEKVITKLRGRAMPPPNMRRPDNATLDAFATYLETAIDRAAATHPDPGRPALHRLNRAEYVNAVRDLLALDVDGSALLPVDDSGYGFDNNGDVLSVSPTLLERYLSAARKISRIAVGDPNVRPVTDAYDVPDDLVQDDRMSEELPLGSRGGIAIRHDFPADGEYVIKVRLKRDGDRTNGEGNPIRGVGLKRQLDIRLDDERVKLLSAGGEQFGTAKQGVFGVDVYNEADPRQDAYERGGADAGLEVQFPAKAGPHQVAVAFLAVDSSLPEGVFRGPSNSRRGGKLAEPWVERVTISGPYNPTSLGETPSRRKIFICRPTGPETEEPCARKILTAIAHRAYRRPVTQEDLRPLLSLYEKTRTAAGFEMGIRTALERILAGPEFLFRSERDPADSGTGPYRITDLELASRLSFFLWSTIPDDQLLDLAEHGKLKDPAVLEQQVRRMLADGRSDALISNFFGQWLQTRQVAELKPDVVEFPEWDENLRDAFQQETKLFLGSMVREDRPLRDLLDADYTFVNERLARHYGIPNVYGSTFRRVTLTDENRRGLLGQGSILALTSYPVRTSIVLRGVWLLTNILAAPPPAPPPNVPALVERNEDGKIKPMRQSMEEHRANAVCASCHLRMDPLGFALENFNAIGGWRTTEADNVPIDNSGSMPDGTEFKGPAELRKILLSRTDQFAFAVTEKLLTYAMGRGAEYFDAPAIRKIKRSAAPDYRWSSLIMGIVKSEPFQMRNRQP